MSVNPLEAALLFGYVLFLIAVRLAIIGVTDYIARRFAFDRTWDVWLASKSELLKESQLHVSSAKVMPEADATVSIAIAMNYAQNMLRWRLAVEGVGLTLVALSFAELSVRSILALPYVVLYCAVALLSLRPFLDQLSLQRGRQKQLRTYKDRLDWNL